MRGGAPEDERLGRGRGFAGMKSGFERSVHEGKLLEALEVGDEGELVCFGELNAIVEVSLGHFVAGLHRAGIVNPALELFGIILEESAREGGACAEVSEGRVGGAAVIFGFVGDVAADLVTGETSLFLEERLAGGDERGIFAFFGGLFATPSFDWGYFKCVRDAALVGFEAVWLPQ